MLLAVLDPLARFSSLFGGFLVSRRLPETSFKVRLGKPNRPDGNLLIYVPKVEKEVFGLRPGDLVEVGLKVLKRAEGT